MAFLGCDNTVQVRQDTTDLVQALKGYADDQGLVVEARHTRNPALFFRALIIGELLPAQRAAS
jgi:hypothetical protein